MSYKRIPCNLKVQPWFQDHSVDGKIVLPAVETMLFLAAKSVSVHPEIDIRVMENVHFDKFLEIPANTASISVQFEYAAGTDGRVQVRLLSHMQLATMSRIKEHGELFFGPTERDKKLPPDIDPAPLIDTIKKIDSEHLYTYLVPFGRYYHSLQGTLYLSNFQAWGKLRAPELPFTDPVQAVLGSPFPLDGAMHAACVLGQQLVNFPPFPVGFDRRIIFRPTQAGRDYLTRVSLVTQTGDELVFDLHIFNNDGQLYETVTGIRMRDVSRALKKPTA